MKHVKCQTEGLRTSSQCMQATVKVSSRGTSCDAPVATVSSSSQCSLLYTPGDDTSEAEYEEYDDSSNDPDWDFSADQLDREDEIEYAS